VRRSIAYRNGKHGFTYNSNPGAMAASNNLSIDNAFRNYSREEDFDVPRQYVLPVRRSRLQRQTVGNTDSTNQFWTGANGERCGASWSGALKRSFASDGNLVVTLGGVDVAL